MDFPTQSHIISHINTNSASEIAIDLTSSGSLGLSSRPYDEHNTHFSTSQLTKRGKADRACDACRRRKTKCDGSKTSDNVCTNCLHAKKACTYVEESKPRGPPKAYVIGLEDRMERLEALLAQLRPEEDFSTELGTALVRGSWKDTSSTQPSGEQQPLLSPSELGQRENQAFSTTLDRFSHQQTTRDALDSKFSSGCPHTNDKQQPLEDTDVSESSEEFTNFDIIEIESISGLVQKLTLHGDESANTQPSSGTHVRFHGKSSSVGLVEATQRFKVMRLLESINNNQGSLRDSPESAGDSNPGMSNRRPEYWSMPQREREWEELFLGTPQLISSILAKFPPIDLAVELIRLYFLHANPQFPLLHYPTFYRQWEEGLYQTNLWFVAVCLGVFAVASRWSKDPRLVPEGITSGSGEPDWAFAGWTYCEIGIALHEVRRRLFYPATLFEIQSFSLFGVYIRGTPHYPLAWTLVGIGIRKAQDVGAHRKKVYHSEPTVNEELWKRAFWCLVVLDRIECASLGRGCIVDEEDFDVDLPMEVDDEYWELGNSTLNFKQPERIPAKVSAFNQLIKLSQVMAFATKTLYTIDETKILFGLSSSSWRNEILGRLESTLQEWSASLPEHLSWSKGKENSTYTTEAATLQIAYHLTRLLIYQRFVCTPDSESSFRESFAHQTHSSLSHHIALDICVDAAHACARICEDSHILRGLLTWPIHIYAAELSCTMLLIKLWHVKLKEKYMLAQGAEDIKPPLAQVVEPLIADVRAYIHLLERAEPRWGFITSFLRELRQCLPSDPQSGPLAPAPRLHQFNHSRCADPSPIQSRSLRLSSSSQPSYHDWELTTSQSSEEQKLTAIPVFDGDYGLYTFDNDAMPSPFYQMKAIHYGDNSQTVSTHTPALNITLRSLPYISRMLRPAACSPEQSSNPSRGETVEGPKNDTAFDNSGDPRALNNYHHNLRSDSFRGP